MKNNRIWLIAAVIALVFSGGCRKEPTLTGEVTLKQLKKVAKVRGWHIIGQEFYGKKTNDFTVTDLEGKEYKLSSYTGRNVLINIWAEWCPGCRAEVPEFAELRKSVGENELMILSVAKPRDMQRLREFMQEKKINYPVIVLGEKTLPEPFEINEFIPCSYFVDGEGKLKAAIEGELTAEDIKAIFTAKLN
jgi:thiol-disulfide isomerase/thioredoxin